MNTSKRIYYLSALTLTLLLSAGNVASEGASSGAAPAGDAAKVDAPAEESVLDAARTKGAVVVPDPKPEAQTVTPNTTRVYRGGKHRPLVIIKPEDKSKAPPPKKKVTVDYEPVD